MTVIAKIESWFFNAVEKLIIDINNLPHYVAIAIVSYYMQVEHDYVEIEMLARSKGEDYRSMYYRWKSLDEDIPALIDSIEWAEGRSYDGIAVNICPCCAGAKPDPASINDPRWDVGHSPGCKMVKLREEVDKLRNGLILG